MTEVGGLAGCRVRRVDEPVDGLLALTLRGPAGRGACVVLSVAGPVGWGLVSERPRGQPATAYALRLRKHLRNAVITRAEVSAEGFVLEAARGDRVARLEASRDGALRLTTADGERADRRGAPVERGADSGEAMRDAGPALVERVMRAGPEAQRRALLRGLARRARSLERRLEKIEADAARVSDVPRLRARASALLAALHDLPEDARAVEVTDWSLEPPALVTIPIGEGRTPRQEADALFTRARKLERGAQIAAERRTLTERELEALAALEEGARGADQAALAELEARARRRGVRLDAARGRRDRAARASFRVFYGSEDRPIHVGRGARDNDALTLGAKPWDHWLHARGVPGSHVVVPLGRTETCPSELLIDAAHLAAHHSRLRGEPRVEVTHVARRHVRKPRGYAPGAVRVEREKVLMLRVEPDRLARLLASGKPA